MVLWVLFAFMTAALIWVVLKPFHHVRDRQDSAAGEDRLAVYKAQIAGIDGDVERGVLTASDAEVLRAEVGRRLLVLVDDERDLPGDTAQTDLAAPTQGVTLGVIATVPSIALALYIAIGSPLLPSQPHASRVHQDSDGVRLAELVRRVERQLLQQPEDGKGWDVIAPVYVKTGRYADGAEAYRKATRILGETPARVFGFAEARVFADNGIVSEASRKAFLRGLALQPNRPTARFWLAIAKQQDGNLMAARQDLAGLLERTDDGSPFKRTIADHLRDIDAKLRDAGQVPVPAVVASQSNAETAAMIDGMVSGLAQRLKDDANDLKGWKRLIRSYVVLQRSTDAATAMRKAREVFAAEPGKLDQLRKLARELNLGS